MLYAARQKIQDSLLKQARCYIFSVGFLVFSGCSVQKDIQEDVHTISENTKTLERVALALESLANDFRAASENIETFKRIASKLEEVLERFPEISDNLSHLENISDNLSYLKNLENEGLIEKLNLILDSLLLSLQTDNSDDLATEIEDFGVEVEDLFSGDEEEIKGEDNDL